MMGNLYAESGLHPNNLQNTYEKSLGLTDAEYTAKVDDGSYTNFVHDSAGYGLAQWTYWSRKEKLLNFVKAAGKSVGDLETQLNFLWQELTGYTSLLNTLKTAKTVTEASTAVLTIYERPADQGEAVQKKRAGFGQTFFDKYAGKENTTTTTAEPTAEIHVGDLVKITGSNYYGGGKAIPGWVKNRKWVVYSVKGDRVVINKDEAGKSAIMSPVNADDLEVVKAVEVTEDTVETTVYETYTVKDGDTLWGIAKTQLGSGSRYTEIKTLNGLTSDAIYTGMKLKLPQK